MKFFEAISFIADVAGAIGGIVAAIGVIRLLITQRRLGEKVEVELLLQSERKSIPLPLELKRRDVTRAELLGRIGMLPMRKPGARFSLRALSTPAFMAALNEVVEGRVSWLSIPATAEEIEQFDL